MFEPLLSAISPFWALTNSVVRAVCAGRGKRLPVPVISVGNIVAGGVGKTELTVALAARLVGQGKRVVVASRGYGSRWESKGAVAFDAESAVALHFPDEAIVTLKKVPGVAVAVGADRFEVLTKNWEELRPDVVLLDDGYQHFKLVRDLDILVHDFSVRWPILRELPRVFERASIRVALSEVPSQWTRLPWVKARYRLTNVVDSAGKRTSLPTEAIAFCGLGNPSRFRKSLTASGVSVVGFRSFRDHISYGASHVRQLVEWQRSFGKAYPLLTTLKDQVKLVSYIESQGGIAGFEPAWVELALEFVNNEHLLWEAVDEALKRRRV